MEPEVPFTVRVYVPATVPPDPPPPLLLPLPPQEQRSANRTIGNPYMKREFFRRRFEAAGRIKMPARATA